MRYVIDPYLIDKTANNPQYEILKDYHVTDQEMQEAFDSFSACLKPHNITSKWTPADWNSTFGPSHESQDWYQRDAKNDEERIAAVDKAMEYYDSCTPLIDGVIIAYVEQQRSLDGRDANIRLRDALVECGFTQFEGKSSTETAELWKTSDIDFFENTCFDEASKKGDF